MEKSCRNAYEYALENANKKERRRLENINPLYNCDKWIEDLLYTTKLVTKYKGSLYGKKNYNSLILPFIFCKEYSLKDLLNRAKGGIQSIKLLWQELMKINFENTLEYKVPIIFIEGKHDKHVSSNLVAQYYEKLKTRKELIWFEYSCHFPQWSENEKFNQILMNIVDKTI